jgi:RNA polymerase sigma factor (TIGR02999 family)
MTGQDVTRLLAAARDGERRALEQLYAVVYGELRGMAEARLRRERSGHTLQPTALVNEVYLRLDPAKDSWANRRHFFGAASQAMRRILVDHARRRLADKRGAGLERVTLSDLDVESPQAAGVDIVALDDALKDLHRDEPRLAEVVTLRVFAGMSIEQTADALELSPATVKRDWTFARAWLAERMADDSLGPSSPG